MTRWLALALLLTACDPHVRLRAPARDAPAAERLASYRALTPRGYWRARAQGDSEWTVGELVLENGTRVYYPEDLLPLLPDDSPARHSAQSARRYAILTDTFGLIATGFGIASVLAFTSDDYDRWTWPLAGGFLLFSIPSWVFSSKNNAAKRRTYGQYDDALRARLNVCVDKLRFVDCGAASPP